MPGYWELGQSQSVLCCILHTDNTSIAWAFGLRSLKVPGPVIGLAGMPFDMARNTAAMKALENGFDWLFFLDSDVIPPPDAIHRLMAHNQPIISGVYHRRSHPHGVPVMLKDGQWIQNPPKNKVIDVDLVGAGCLLIHRDVLDRLPPQRPGKHWFDWRVDMRGVEGLEPGECMSEDFTFCFPQGTWVMGKKVSRIEDVQIGDTVINHVGASAKVLDKSNRLYSGQMVKITASYVRDIEATAGHKFYVKTTRAAGRTVVFNAIQPGRTSITSIEVEVKTKKTMWVEARDVQEGDWLYVPKIKIRKGNRIRSFYISHYISTRLLTTFPDGKVGYSRTRLDALRINPTTAVTEDLCRLLGYYLAEGFCPGEKHTLQFAFGSHETDYVEDCKSLLTNIFGAKVSEKTETGCTRLTCSSRVLGRLFSALCGTGAHNKHLPRFWTRLSKECLTSLIKGYWRGDGACTSKTFSMSTVSSRLARELQCAMLRLNVLAGVNTYENEYGKVYVVIIPAKLADRFSSLVDYHEYDKTPTREQDRYMKETNTHFLVQVQSTKHYGWEGQVYNLKVAGRETYTANGVAVHNCVHAKRHGYRVLVDTSVICKHVGFAEFNHASCGPLDCQPA